MSATAPRAAPASPSRERRPIVSRDEPDSLWLAGQGDKIAGCRVVGIAGSEAGCRYATENAPDALRMLFQPNKVGKLLLKVAD